MKNIQYEQKNTPIKCRKNVLNFGEKTYIMGILNITPDSFSDGGKFLYVDEAAKHAHHMIEQGADIIDVGGESTRPGSTRISSEEELERILPIVKKLKQEIKVPISVDTYKSEVAESVLEVGADIINDIWGLQYDEKMASVVAKYDVPIVIMHNQNGHEYKRDIIEEMKEFFKKSIEIALNAGIKKEKIILDPGIGFGKTPEQNMLVMSRLGELKSLGQPILLGTSRKSMIGKILDLPEDQRVEGTIATTVMGIIQGVDIVRVHDIRENNLAIKVTDAIVRGM